MALEPCVPCNCIPGNISNDKFKQDVELILCAILEAFDGGGISVTIAPVNPVPRFSAAFGTITDTPQNSGLFGSGSKFGYLHITNTTDATIIISSDSSTEWFVIPSGGERDIQIPVQLSGDLGGIYYHASPALPTIGTLYIEGGNY